MTVQSPPDSQHSDRIPLRMPLHPGIDEELIERLVRTFYDRVRADEELGPIFARVIADDWEPHLRNMMDFWSSVTMMTGRFKGRPMPKHKALHDLRPEHFGRWLGLFQVTARDICPPEIAVIFIDRAERIAASLALGIFGLPETNG